MGRSAWARFIDLQHWRHEIMGFLILHAVWCLRMAGKLADSDWTRNDIQQGLRGLWDAGLDARDIDGGPAELIKKTGSSREYADAPDSAADQPA